MLVHVANGWQASSYGPPYGQRPPTVPTVNPTATLKTVGAIPGRDIEQQVTHVHPKSSRLGPSLRPWQSLKQLKISWRPRLATCPIVRTLGCSSIFQSGGCNELRGFDRMGWDARSSAAWRLWPQPRHTVGRLRHPMIIMAFKLAGHPIPIIQ